MKAIVFDKPGDESVLHIGDVDPPGMGPADVRIGVHATAVNRADILQRQGQYPPPPGASEILGLECSGDVLETGNGVTAFKRGDHVMALLPGGGYAEQAVAHEGSVMHVPGVLSIEEAGAIPEVFLTAFLNVFMIAHAASGETLLVHGGGSGVGTAATTLGKLAGLKVIVTAGSDEKCARCIEHGADEAINYRTEDFSTKLRDIDIVLDHIGAAYLPKDLSVLRMDGRVVLIGSMGGVRSAEIDVTAVIARRLQISGSTLRARRPEQKAAIVKGFVDRFGSDLTAGRIKPAVDQVLLLEQAAQAHRLMASSDHFGKIVLRVK